MISILISYPYLNLRRVLFINFFLFNYGQNRIIPITEDLIYFQFRKDYIFLSIIQTFSNIFYKNRGGNSLIIYYLIHNPIRMALLYLNQSAHIIDKIRESDVELLPQNPDSPEKQSLHALLHKSESMFYPATFPCLVPVAFLLFIRELGVPSCSHAQTNLFHFSSDISYIFQTSYKYNKNINIIE